MSASDDEEYTVPLQDQRVFGAGIKRKRVQFVPSTDTASSPATPQSGGHSASDFYLNLVLPQPASINSFLEPTPEHRGHTEVETGQEPEQRVTLPYSPQARLICETCRLPISTKDSVTPHAALLAHQLSLPHSHPPSSLSRTHRGLKILQAHGWDPDARTGLGVTGEGIRVPIKGKEKRDKMGIGAEIPKPRKGDKEVSRAVEEARVKKKKEEERGRKGKGWVKKQVQEEKRRGDKLKDLFYASESVDKYLGRTETGP